MGNGMGNCQCSLSSFIEEGELNIPTAANLQQTHQQHERLTEQPELATVRTPAALDANEAPLFDPPPGTDVSPQNIQQHGSLADLPVPAAASKPAASVANDATWIDFAKENETMRSLRKRQQCESSVERPVLTVVNKPAGPVANDAPRPTPVQGPEIARSPQKKQQHESPPEQPVPTTALFANHAPRLDPAPGTDMGHPRQNDHKDGSPAGPPPQTASPPWQELGDEETESVLLKDGGQQNNDQITVPLNDWPQQVDANDAALQPPLCEPQNDERTLKWYDRKTGDSYNEVLADRVPRIALAGKAKSGKTWLLHQLAGFHLDCTNTQVLCTPRLCCKHLHLHGKACHFIDSKGEQAPLFDLSSTDEKLEDAVLSQTLCSISDSLIYIVNHGGYSEQLMLMNLFEKQRAQDYNFTIIVVHNLKHVFRKGDFKTSKHAICELYVTQGLSLETFGEVDALLGPSSSNSNTKRIHVFFAQHCEELSQINDQTLQFLREKLALSLPREAQNRRDLRKELECISQEILHREFTCHDFEGNTPAETLLKPTYAGYRVVETKDGSVRAEIESPGYSRQLMDTDLAKEGEHKFLSIAKAKTSVGVNITVRPACIHPFVAKSCVPNDDELGVEEADMALITLQKRMSLSCLSPPEYRGGTVLLTFSPEVEAGP